MDLFLRIATLTGFIIWHIYWKVSEKKAYEEKPRTSKKKDFVDLYIGRTVIGVTLLLQFFGVQILPIEPNFNLQLTGFIIFLLGITVSMSARVSLGTNWANAHEYQIKQKQTLVTKGIYKYIRHPIYTGLLIAITGAELVCQSYLFIIMFIIGFFWAYTRGKREEIILEKHFGKSYTEYKKKSKMLIPFIF